MFYLCIYSRNFDKNGDNIHNCLWTIILLISFLFPVLFYPVILSSNYSESLCISGKYLMYVNPEKVSNGVLKSLFAYCKNNSKWKNFNTFILSKPDELPWLELEPAEFRWHTLHDKLSEFCALIYRDRCFIEADEDGDALIKFPLHSFSSLEESESFFILFFLTNNSLLNRLCNIKTQNG